ncbi:MAG: nitroreductase family protein [Dehalococcoidia bacterium]|jgi:nitroreductase|nr:nitroreductase family protein [Dehalococcoidia bacterium]
MDVRELILQNRSFRRFHQDVPVDMQTLRELVDLARISQSPWNQQAVKFLLCNRPEKNADIFPLLHWASRMPEWGGPVEGERPAAYIIVVADKQLGKIFNYDHVVAGMSILLGAVERGLGGCLVGAFSKKSMHAMLKLDERYEPLLAIALGKPNETIVLDPVGPDGNTAYWNDERGVHHVPKRALEDLILGEL